MSKDCAVILAAGEGKRMKSSCPKVLATVLLKPMLDWVIDSVKESSLDDICVVTGHLSDFVCSHLDSSTETVLQSERLGTGHAVMQTRDFILSHIDGNVLVLNGDAPLMDSVTIQKALEYHISRNNSVTVISANVENPFGYGRIVRNTDGTLTRIVEERDANETIKKITEINSGAFWFDAQALIAALDNIKPENDQNEYYLTDAVEIIIKSGLNAGAYTADNPLVVLGANDRVQLMELNEIARNTIIKKHLLNGVDIPCPDGIIIGPDVKIGNDTLILPGTILKGFVEIGKSCNIGPNSFISDSVIGDNVNLDNVNCEKSKVASGADIGPFVHIRPNSDIRENVHLGNFVEVKNSVIDSDTKVSHLTYVGDSDVGKNVNFGCGCVTVNYTGKTKNRTTIKDHAFIGCNTNLVAPVTVGEYGYTAAGSTITHDVPDNALAIARSRQENKEDWVKVNKPLKGME